MTDNEPKEPLSASDVAITPSDIENANRATCETCIFGRSHIAQIDLGDGKKPQPREVYRCHVAKPGVMKGFPIVSGCDFCGMHVHRKTGVRTFAWMLSADNTHV